MQSEPHAPHMMATHTLLFSSPLLMSHACASIAASQSPSPSPSPGTFDCHHHNSQLTHTHTHTHTLCPSSSTLSQFVQLLQQHVRVRHEHPLNQLCNGENKARAGCNGHDCHSHHGWVICPHRCSCHVLSTMGPVQRGQPACAIARVGGKRDCGGLMSIQ